MPNPENLIGKGFDKNPQNINRTGANRKSFATVNKELKKKELSQFKNKILLMLILLFSMPQKMS